MLPEEFEQVCKAYAEQREAESRGDWERMRWLATITIQPHIKGHPTPQKVLPFPWDNQKPKTDQKPVSKEESKARFESLIARVKNADNG